MRGSQRYITSLLMVVLYLMISGLPLAPLAMHSPRIAHAITGECSGDCSICGCAPERSAARACCCWQKKLAAERAEARSDGKSCCSKEKESRMAKSCATASKCGHCDHDEAAVSDDRAEDKIKQIASISSCPCNSGKHLLLWGADNIQHLPYIYSGGIPLLQNHGYASLPPDRLISHHGEPPDPPPRLSLPA